MFLVVSWCCGLREGWGWVSVSTASSSVCHPLKGLPAQGSLLLLCASCCSVTPHLWLQGPFVIIQWLLHDNQWIFHELLLIIIQWVTCLLTISTCPPCQALQGVALGLWLKPHDSFPFFFSGKYLSRYVSLPPAQENSIYSSDWEKLTQNEHVLSLRAQLLKLKMFASQIPVSDLNFQKTSLKTIKLRCEMQAVTLLCAVHAIDTSWCPTVVRGS